MVLISLPCQLRVFLTSQLLATRVMIEFADASRNKKWTTVSVDRNIISASLNALVDGFEYALKDVIASCMLDDLSDHGSAEQP